MSPNSETFVVSTLPLIPLIETMFVQGALALSSAASCDNDTARSLVFAIDALHRVALEFHQQVDDSLWFDELRRLSDRDDRNPMLSGYACRAVGGRSA
ncbi:MAG: hypothetical protein R3C05_20520 [Pirellulaceae bacterium]